MTFSKHLLNPTSHCNKSQYIVQTQLCICNADALHVACAPFVGVPGVANQPPMPLPYAVRIM